MSVQKIESLRALLFLLLDTELTGERVVQFAMDAFHVSHADVSRVWNDMLCAKHGI